MGECAEGLPGSPKSAACGKRNGENLGGPVGSWTAVTPDQVGTSERTSRVAEDRRESDQSIGLGDGWAGHKGKGLTGTRSLYRKHGPDMQGRQAVPTSLEAIAEGDASASVPEEPGAVIPHAGIRAGRGRATALSTATCAKKLGVSDWV